MSKKKVLTNEEIADKYAKNVTEYLKRNHDVIDEHIKVLIDMLRDNYLLFLLAKKDIQDNGITVTNNRGNIDKNPSVKIQIDSEIQMLKVIAELGLSYRAESKINAPVATDDGDDYLNQLIQ